jgi:hypothetical protein
MVKKYYISDKTLFMAVEDSDKEDFEEEYEEDEE